MIESSNLAIHLNLGQAGEMERIPATGPESGADEEITSVSDLAVALDQALTRAGRGNAARSRIPKAAGISSSTFYAALAGNTLPRADTLDAILEAAKVPSDEAERLAAARNGLDRRRRRRGAAGGPPDVVTVAAVAAVVTDEAVPRGRWPRALVIAAVAVLILAAVVAGVVLLRHLTGNTFPRLRTLQAPRQPDWSSSQVVCASQKKWHYQFSDHYRGDVYVQLTPATFTPVTADVTLTWGDLHWTGRAVVVYPGVLPQRLGGTLLRFIKKESIDSDPTDWNPGVELTSSVPVCAVFGTAGTNPTPAPSSLVQTPGWLPN